MTSSAQRQTVDPNVGQPSDGLGFNNFSFDNVITNARNFFGFGDSSTTPEPSNSAQRGRVTAPESSNQVLVASAQRGQVDAASSGNGNNGLGFDIRRFLGLGDEDNTTDSQAGSAQRGQVTSPEPTPTVSPRPRTPVAPPPVIEPVPTVRSQPVAPNRPSELMLGRPYPGSLIGIKNGVWPRGAEVEAIQLRLNRHGIPVEEDGIFGPKTEAAIIRFQRAKGLKVDGIVGPETWRALFSA